MLQDPIVIVSAKRTPMGGMLGSLASLNAVQLGAHAIKASIDSAGLSPQQVEATLMGCVLPAGLGQAPARQAAVYAGIPYSSGATTLNKMCGSGMMAMMLAHDALALDQHKIICAGGMESMSNAPYLMMKARQGYRLGHDTVYDHMMRDGLEDAYESGLSMGVFGDRTAKHFKMTRKQLDDFALESVSRAQAASAQGLFNNEMAAITVKTRRDEIVIDSDDGIKSAKPEKIPKLRAAFSKDGVVTAANSSSISDGAAACVLMRKSTAESLNLTPLATIVAHASHANEPEWFTTAPVSAINKVLAKAGWHSNEVDLYEINEAFAVVTLAAMQQCELDHAKVNVHGGACVLGHPIGASGARILVTLIHALKQRGLSKGVASLCIGGGEATAMAIEL